MSAMNTAQRAVLLLSALATLAMCWIPPCKSYGGELVYYTIWERQWIHPPIFFPQLFGQIAIVLVITGLFVLAFKSPNKTT